MTYRYPTGRTAEEVYDTLYRDTSYGTGERGRGAEQFCKGYKSLLDVGGGKTPTALRYAKYAALERVVVCDISAEALKEQVAAHVHCDVTVGLPFADDEFDVVTCFDVMEHIQPDKVDFVIAELGRVAKHRIILAIATKQTPKRGSKREKLHLTLQPRKWWLKKLGAVGKVSVHKCVAFVKHNHKHYAERLLVELA